MKGRTHVFDKSVFENGEPEPFERERKIGHCELHLSRVRWALVFGHQTVPLSGEMWNRLASGVDPNATVRPLTLRPEAQTGGVGRDPVR
jgi:hypothetical protein